ncbi:AraC family transcriptional regulator [Pseudomonas sp. EggHat1]|uniref:AraC family transcriptional regulator n=1 Tax=Pseudomonas sp. EggHat1 TaxID=2761624 RepID=UPI0018674006|nr:AraC family transcriptional regulator [Pseudomonas sp. EggHat1]
MASASAEKGTISIRLVREALQEWRQRGCDEASLLQGAGIDGELLAEPDGRVSSEAYGQLWLGIAQQMDDEFFGMNPRRMKTGSFAYMARAAVKEPTLGSALQGALRLLHLIFDGFSPRLEVRDGLAAIVIDEPPERCCRAFGYFTLWLMIHGLTCWLAGRRIDVLGIHLRCAQPDYIEDYQVMFTRNLHFGRPQSRLLFNAESLQTPIRRSPRDLKRFLAGAPANILVRYRDPQSLGARIKAHLRSLPPAHWPDVEALAGHFHMAPSTLRRKLSLQGQSYQGLKDQVRRDLAIACLDGEPGSFSDLAFELGFADTSAFYKAFKKWTGSTPGQYRALVHAANA